MNVQLGVRLTRFPPLTVKELLHIECLPSHQEVIDGTGQTMGEAGQRLTLAMCLLKCRELFLPLGILPQKQDGGF